MKYKIGDQVELIDDSMKGVISAIVGHEILIKTEDGFEVRVSENELMPLPPRESLKVSIFDVEKAKQEKEKATKKPSPSPRTEKIAPPMEVDLHIHQLTPSSKGMSNHEMLNLQLDTAKRQLEFAMRNRIQKIVFIHGVGEGVLKTELEYLFRRYSNLTWYEANYQKYGLGATEIYIYQNPKEVN